jgi:hypothetical protein
MDKELLESLVGAARLQGQIEYNLEMDIGRLQKRRTIVSEYREKYESALTPYRSSSKLVSEIMDFFDKL